MSVRVPRVVVGLTLLALFGGPAQAALAQGGEVTGLVVEADGAAVSGALVEFRAAGGGEPVRTTTDGHGRFEVRGLASAVYEATFSCDGFADLTIRSIAVAAAPVELPAVTLRRTAFDEVVVVTATRIEESPQHVPMSISATTGADLEQRAINNLSELSRWTPGLTVVDQGARSSNVVIVRGLHTAALNGSGSGRNDSVASYLGDIPLPIDLRLQDIERVEVLLGPQGTLYGAGTLAGAVRYLPRRPDPGERFFEIRGDLFALEHGGSPGNDAGFTFNLPLAPGRLALRGSVNRFYEPGFIDYDFLLRVPGVSEPEPDLDDPASVATNLRSEPDANTEETVSARFSLLWQPTPDLTATLAYHLQDQEVGARQVNHARSFDTGRYVSAHRYPEPSDRKDELLSLELTWKLRSAELSSAFGYSRASSWGQSDQTDLLIQEFGISGLLPGTFPALVRERESDPNVTVNDLTSAFRTFSAYARGRSRRERFNWETRLAATGGGPWRWVGGVFLNRRDSRGTGAEYAPGLTAFSGITPVLGGTPVSEPIEYYSVGETEVEERALFGEISRDLGRRWRFLAGGRWFGYDVRTANLTEFPYTPAYNSPYSDHESEDRGVLFKGSLSYRLSDRTTLYFTRSKGYRIGGGNNFRVCTDEEIALLTDDDAGNDPPQSGCIYAHQALIRPDTTLNHEIGIRRSWRRGNASATVFHVDWTDIQVAGVTPFSSQGITLNGGAAMSRGVELAAAVSLTNEFRLRGSWSFARAELSKDSPGILDDGNDAFEGDRLSGAPEHQGGLLASWSKPIGDEHLLELLYGYSYVGNVLTRIGMRSGGEILPSYDLHNLSAAISRNAWTLTLYVENLLDEYAVTSVRQTPRLIGRTEEGFKSRRYFANVLTPRRAGLRFRFALW